MAPKQAKKGRAARTRRAPRKAARRAGGLEFNHAMIYTADYPRALAFYRDLLGFALLDEYPGGYGRLRSPGGDTTIALHAVEEGRPMDASREGIRLYLEVRALDRFCRELAAKGVKFDQTPQDMPWGWRHAYLRDPDGHELSLYWAGAKRLRRTAIRGTH